MNLNRNRNNGIRNLIILLYIKALFETQKILEKKTKKNNFLIFDFIVKKKKSNLIKIL